MGSQLVRGMYLLQVLSLINNNFEVLKDLLHNRSRGMELAEFTALRRTIFDILQSRVDTRVTRFWDAHTYPHYILDSRRDERPNQTLWVLLYGTQYPHLVCQLFLLNDWNLNYPFAMKGKQLENTGLPLWMVHAAVRKAESRGSSVAALSTSHNIPLHQQIRPQAAQQQRLLGNDLFYSPTAQGVQRPIYYRSETYYNTTHQGELRRPTTLAQQLKYSKPSTARAPQDFVGQATLHHSSLGLIFTNKPIKPTSQPLLDTRSIALSKQHPKKAITWPSEEADQFHYNKAYQPANRLGALDFLPRISKVTPDMLKQTFGHLVMAMCTQAAEELPIPDCCHCSAIISTNIMIARERMIPSRQAEQLRLLASERFQWLGHEEIRPTSLVTIDLPELPFEQKIRNIAFQLGAITSRADEDVRSRQVWETLGNVEEITLGDTGNRTRDIFQQENRRPTTSPTEDRTRTSVNPIAPSISRSTEPFLRATVNTPTHGITVPIRPLPRM